MWNTDSHLQQQHDHLVGQLQIIIKIIIYTSSFRIFNNNTNNNTMENNKTVEEVKKTHKTLKNGWIKKNEKGGFYQPGREYDFVQKCKVADIYISLLVSNFPKNVAVKDVSDEAKVSWRFAKKCIDEIDLHGDVIDPEQIKLQRLQCQIITYKITKIDEVFLLSMHAEEPRRPNVDYVTELLFHRGVDVTSQTIGNFFARRFDNKGTFVKPNLIPLDKWKLDNLAKFHDFFNTILELPDLTRYNWIDEKHIVNKDCLPNRVRRDPVTGYIPFIPVSGDFRDAYNVFACILPSEEKICPVFFQIVKNNGNSITFVNFIIAMINNRYLTHDEVIIMDNAKIHTCGEAETVEKLLWETVVDGRPLHILVVYLPTRSPELNPIELIFHILSRRIKRYRYDIGTDIDHAVVRLASEVLNTMSTGLIQKCVEHCGYVSVFDDDSEDNSASNE